MENVYASSIRVTTNKNFTIKSNPRTHWAEVVLYVVSVHHLCMWRIVNLKCIHGEKSK